MVPRGLAVQVLTAVLSDGEALDQALERISKQSRLDTQARAWLLDVCAGTLRWKGRLDAAIDSTALKKKPSGWLRKILLIATYQLLVQERVAPAIVVSETVSEVKKKEGEAPAKFANASLRKIAEYARQWKDLPFPEKGSLSEKASWASLPEWFWQRIVRQRGEDWARQFAQAALERPKLWLRLAPAVSLPQEGEAGPVAGSFAPSDGGAIADRAGFSEGRFFVQDISSQLLVSEISSEVKKSLGDRNRPTALDLCSAPGGKALGLSWNGFDVTATDVDASRLALVRENIQRLRSDIKIIERTEVANHEAQDLVWIDAPCTGSGIIRRHPDVRWLRKEKDLQALTRSQLDLIREGWSKVRSGGLLAYSVCSIFEEEGPAVLKQCGLEQNVRKTWLLSPHQSPRGDGFWAALLLKS